MKPSLEVAARVLALVTLFAIFEWLVRGVANLPPESYYQPSITVELGERILRLAVSRRAWLLLPPALIVAILLFRSPAFRHNVAGLWHGWPSLEHGRALRLFVGFIALVAAWAFATYDYNLYFDQSHYVDRLLLLLLAALLFWKPIFVLPYLLLLVSIITQFTYPLRAYPWTEVNLLVRILVLFFAAFLLHGLTGRRGTNDFLFVLCCLFAVNYWWSGVGKFRLNWISHPHLNLLLFGAYANGWLAFLEPSTVVRLSDLLARVNLPLMIFTLLVEWGSLLILWRRSTLLGLLAGFILMHLGIFGVTGMFFWKWVLVEAAFIVFLLSRNRVQSLPIFTPTHFLLSLVLIVGCRAWVRPTNLSWYDTPLTYTYRIEGVGESGTVYTLPTPVFSPYADIFLLGIFPYLNPHPQLTGVMGITTNHPLADTLLRLSTPDQVFTLERENRDSTYDAAASSRFDRFMVQFIGNLNRRRSRDTWLSPVRAPPHLWSFPRDRAFRMQEPITHVIVYEVTSFFDGERYADIRKRAIRTIEIPTYRPSASSEFTPRGSRGDGPGAPGRRSLDAVR